MGQTARGSRRGTTAGRFDDAVRSQPARREPNTQPKLTVAEAEAEIRAAIEAIRPKGDEPSAEITKDPRCVRAIAALTKAVTLDKDDRSNLSAYLRRQGTRPSPEIIIKAFKRWPRIRKYWPRLRRRICSGCGKQYDLSEPRLWVCSGCEDARYCDEACQRAHWLDHRSQCFETLERRIKKRVSEGVPKPEVRREFRHLLDVFAMPRNM